MHKFAQMIFGKQLDAAFRRMNVRKEPEPPPLPEVSCHSDTCFSGSGGYDYYDRSTPWPYCHQEPTDAKKPLKSGKNFGAWLQNRGWKLLGHGAYSYVYGKDGCDKVIKVTDGQGDNWIDYIHWAAKNGYCGTFAPRVYSWKRLDKFSVAIVERLEKTVRHAEDHDFALMEHLLWPAMRGHTMAQLYIDDLAPGAAKFFEELKKELDPGDLYGNNMMIRKDGSFCVTDPVCGRSKLKIRRLRTGDLSPVPTHTRGSFESCYRYRMQQAA